MKRGEKGSAPDASHRLDGRIALITGAGRGIGRACAIELARRGARVIAAGRNPDYLAEACARVKERGGDAQAIEADLRTDRGHAALAPWTDKIDVLVNNAAAFAPYGDLEEMQIADAARVIETMLVGPLRLTGAVLPSMKERRFGRIVNMGSMAAVLGARRQALYASVKASLAGMTRSVALEGAPHGVTCNLLEIGFIATERVQETIPAEIRDALVRNTPVARAGTAEEVACVVGFLASPAASFVTGASIPVSGGLGLGLFSAPEL